MITSTIYRSIRKKKTNPDPIRYTIDIDNNIEIPNSDIVFCFVVGMDRRYNIAYWRNRWWFIKAWGFSDAMTSRLHLHHYDSIRDKDILKAFALVREQYVFN